MKFELMQYSYSAQKLQTEIYLHTGREKGKASEWTNELMNKQDGGKPAPHRTAVVSVPDPPSSSTHDD